MLNIALFIAENQFSFLLVKVALQANDLKLNIKSLKLQYFHLK